VTYHKTMGFMVRTVYGAYGLWCVQR